MLFDLQNLYKFIRLYLENEEKYELAMNKVTEKFSSRLDDFIRDSQISIDADEYDKKLERDEDELN